MNELQYKGYISVIKQDPDTHKLYGKIDGIKDFVNFIRLYQKKSNISKGYCGSYVKAIV